MTFGPTRRHNSLVFSELQRSRFKSFYFLYKEGHHCHGNYYKFSFHSLGRFDDKASFVFLGKTFLDKTNHATLGIKEASI